MESDPAFQMSQDEVVPMNAFGTLVRLEILSHELWLSIWLMALRSRGLVRYADGARMADWSVAGVYEG
jgi:hypothetical protein